MLWEKNRGRNGAVKKPLTPGLKSYSMVYSNQIKNIEIGIYK
jgi:hypothetical protein